MLTCAQITIRDMDVCCLRFVSVYEMNELIKYEFGRLASDEEYNNHYVNFLNVDG